MKKAQKVKEAQPRALWVGAVIKSVCVGGRLIENYSPKNFTEVKVEIDRWIAVDKSKSIIRMRGEYTINFQVFIFWN